VQTKITFIYDNPVDADAFESAFPGQIAVAKTVPGVRTIEVSKVWPKEDGSATPAGRLLDLYFDDYDTASAAVGTEQASRLFANVFAAATGGVTIVFAAVEERSDLSSPTEREVEAVALG
jgi:uncharacterized protein (TIGR02118 family)